jgi:type VI secretion system protein ImpK
MTDAFADLVMPIFHRLIHLRDRLARGEPKTIDDVRRATTAWIEEADRRAAAGASPELRQSYNRARFGLVALIDEVLNDSEWGQAVGWGSEEHFLEWFMYQSRSRAYRFYEHADAAEARGDVDALEAYLLCACLGFKGDFAHDPQQLNAWVERAYGRIAEAGAVASRPFPDEESAARAFGPLGGPSLLVAASILFAITALATLSAYLFAVHYSYRPAG